MSMKIKPEVLEYAHKRLTEATYDKNSDFAKGAKHELLSIIAQGIKDYRELLNFEIYAQKRFEEADKIIQRQNILIEEYKRRLRKTMTKSMTTFLIMGAPTQTSVAFVVGRAEAMGRFMPPAASGSTIC